MLDIHESKQTGAKPFEQFKVKAKFSLFFPFISAMSYTNSCEFWGFTTLILGSFPIKSIDVSEANELNMWKPSST